MYKVYHKNDFKNKHSKETSSSIMVEYLVVWEGKNSIRVVSSVPRFYKDPKGVAEGIAAALNKGNIVLDLTIG